MVWILIEYELLYFRHRLDLQARDMRTALANRSFPDSVNIEEELVRIEQLTAEKEAKEQEQLKMQQAAAQQRGVNNNG